MASVSLKTIEQNDNVSLFSICFEGSQEEYGTEWVRDGPAEV